MKRARKPILILAITSILILSQAIGAFAISAGDSVSYKHHTYDDGAVSFTVNGQYTGTCTYPGRTANNGTGTVDGRLANTDVTVKVIYVYAIQKGWMTKSGKNSEFNGMTYPMCLERMVQYAYRGMYHPATSDATNKVIKSKVDELKNQAVDIPDTFQVYHVNVSGNNQDFVFWVDAPPTGFASVKKVSGNTDITG